MNPARKSTLVSYLDDDDDSDDGDITGYANNINHVVQDIYITVSTSIKDFKKFD